MNDLVATRADAVTVASEAVRVTFYEDRAEVVRVARCVVPAGVSWVAVTGVTALVDDPSLVASIAGEGPRVIGHRVLRRVRKDPAAAAQELEASEADLTASRRRRAAAERALGRAQGDQARVVALLDAWREALRRVPRGGAAGVARWAQAFGAMHDAMGQALDAVAAAREELFRAELDEARARARRDQARVVHPRYEAAVEVQVEAREGCEVHIELGYRTPCALWRPEHLCRLVTEGGKAPTLVVKTMATVWQHTGEAWKGVACRFSTARPARSAAAPWLSDDVLVLRKKSEAERRAVAVEARDQSVAVTGVGRGARAVEEMPGVEDGGEAVCFEARAPATIPSDGQPFRVEVAQATMPCAVDRVCYPERSAAAHVRATATLAGDQPLLAGPVRVARGGELVGRGRTGFVGRGDVFELGFGVDDGIRVRRHVEEKRETTAVIGTQKIERTVRLYVSNLSGETKRVTVTERWPVSEIGDVKVELVSGGGARLDRRDGFAHFDVEVPARGTEERALAYRIEAGARVYGL